MILHAGLIAHWSQEFGWRGALIEGPSGSGKSDLALRCLQAGFRLVADDRVLAWRSGDAAYGRAPESLMGLIEARGVGVVHGPALPLCRIVLRIQLAGPGETVERLPDRLLSRLLGVDMPLLQLSPFEASTPAKLALAMQRLGQGRQEEY